MVEGAVDDLRARGVLPPVAALLRRPAMWTQHQILAALRDAGYDDVLPAHLGVFQYPGPDGQRPGVLALRASSTKQAMNHLLRQLESGGYILREAEPGDRRFRQVRLTQRGWAAVEVIRAAVERIETAWVELLGRSSYAGLQRALSELDAALDQGWGGASED